MQFFKLKPWHHFFLKQKGFSLVSFSNKTSLFSLALVVRLWNVAFNMPVVTCSLSSHGENGNCYDYFQAKLFGIDLKIFCRSMGRSSYFSKIIADILPFWYCVRINLAVPNSHWNALQKDLFGQLMKCIWIVALNYNGSSFLNTSFMHFVLFFFFMLVNEMVTRWNVLCVVHLSLYSPNSQSCEVQLIFNCVLLLKAWEVKDFSSAFWEHFAQVKRWDFTTLSQMQPYVALNLAGGLWGFMQFQAEC